jgi:hypothetical protein
VPTGEKDWDAAGSQRPPEFLSASPITMGSDAAVAEPVTAPEQSVEAK